MKEELDMKVKVENKLDGARKPVIDFSKEQWYFRAEIFYAEVGDLDKLSSAKEDAKEGDGIKKKRPVLIISNNLANKNPYNPNVIVACITSSPAKIAKFKRKPSPTQMLIMIGDRESLILCEEIKTIAKSRLTDKVGELTSEQIIIVNDTLEKSLGLKWI